MRRILPAIAAVAFIGLASPAFAFTQEPVNAGGSARNAVADPDDQYRTDPSSTTPQRQQQSRFSINGPTSTSTGPRLAAPVERQGPDNDHLFWNNSSRYWR